MENEQTRAYRSMMVYSTAMDRILDGGKVEEGVKYDEGKLRYDLLPSKALEEVVRVYTIGAKKYCDRNWEKGIRYGRVFAAMMRHAWAWWRGERYTKDDTQHHLASVAWCALALMHFDLHEDKYREFDDRPKEDENDKACAASLGCGG